MVIMKSNKLQGKIDKKLLINEKTYLITEQGKKCKSGGKQNILLLIIYFVTVKIEVVVTLSDSLDDFRFKYLSLIYLIGL